MAFSIMIIYATRKLIVDGPQGKPVEANTSGKLMQLPIIAWGYKKIKENYLQS